MRKIVFWNQGWFQVNLDFKVKFMTALKIKIDFKMRQKAYFPTTNRKTGRL